MELKDIFRNVDRSDLFRPVIVVALLGLLEGVDSLVVWFADFVLLLYLFFWFKGLGEPVGPVEVVEKREVSVVRGDGSVGVEEDWFDAF